MRITNGLRERLKELGFESLEDVFDYGPTEAKGDEMNRKRHEALCDLINHACGGNFSLNIVVLISMLIATMNICTENLGQYKATLELAKAMLNREGERSITKPMPWWTKS